MVFDSYFFIFIFLPVLLTGWFGLNRVSGHAAEYFLIGMSLWFYGCFGLAPLTVLLVSMAVNYLFGRVVPAGRKWLAAGLAANLLLLCWFKYATDAISQAAGEEASLPVFFTLALPVGLSFYTFTQMQYLTGRFRGEIPQVSLREYVLYASYFPKLAEGPITCYQEIMSQFHDAKARSANAQNLTRGLVLFVLGLSKKVLIADTLAPAASYGMESAGYLDTLSVLAALACYTLQLYFDFSGYCDMAMGVSLMLNIRLPVNFDAPFRAVTFTDFWRRWHMTLTRFFTRNVYIPLGGSRKGTARTCVNVMIVFLLSGIWHGTGWTFLLWGAVSGVLAVISRLWMQRLDDKADALSSISGLLRPQQSDDCIGKFAYAKFPSQSIRWRGCIRGRLDDRPDGLSSISSRTGLFLRRLWVFWEFALTMCFFAAPSLVHSALIIRNFFSPRFPGWLYRMAGQLDTPELWLVNKAVSILAPSLSSPVALAELLMIMLFAMGLVFQGRSAREISRTMALSTRNAVLVGILAAWCLTSLTGVSTYVYFQF